MVQRRLSCGTLSVTQSAGRINHMVRNATGKRSAYVAARVPVCAAFGRTATTTGMQCVAVRVVISNAKRKVRQVV